MLVVSKVEFVFVDFGDFVEISFYLEFGGIFDMVVFDEESEVVEIFFIFLLVEGIDVVFEFERMFFFEFFVLEFFSFCVEYIYIYVVDGVF